MRGIGKVEVSGFVDGSGPLAEEPQPEAYEPNVAETLCEWALLKKAQNDWDGMRSLAGKALGIFMRCDERTSGMSADKVRWAEGGLMGNVEEQAQNRIETEKNGG